MKYLLQSAVEEIEILRRRNEILSAQVGVVEAFAVALGLRREQGGMHPDVLYQLREQVRAIEMEEAIQNREASWGVGAATPSTLGKEAL